ncbi:MAG: peptide chain release factor N(5)-glutamine methyltransferase [Clostridium sp.]|jgi:release factor glutamine methyltransferase|nr:peptide chain release factor N(5)-glutamine methyltransferase [Clostridium sp.]
MKEEILTLKEALAKAVDKLQQMEVPDADIDAWYLLSYVTGLDRAAFFLHGEEPMAEPDMIRYRDLVTKRGERIPLQHLTGEQEFMGLDFHVNEHVLIPRQDTECLVERVLPYVDGKRVLDVCTGSGCIAIAIAKLGKPLIVHGVDISEEALAVARQNATELNASVELFAGDLMTKMDGQYDVIVSNPPYIPPSVIEGLMPEVRLHEPMLALDGGQDGLEFYRRIAGQAVTRLAPNGRLFLEIGCEQAAAVAEILQKQGYREVQVFQDLAGKDRIVQCIV